jgi:hypothetical protein
VVERPDPMAALLLAATLAWMQRLWSRGVLPTRTWTRTQSAAGHGSPGGGAQGRQSQAQNQA